MEAKPQRLTGANLTAFLRSLGITLVEPVGRSSASGELFDDAQLTELLTRGDPVPPGPGTVVEDADSLRGLFHQADPTACFGLTPDGHLTNHQPLAFEAATAAEQVIQMVEADMAQEDRDEALAATWLGLAYHDRDHPSDFGGLVPDRSSDGRPKCCYLDVKGTRALTPGAQRTKLEQRAQERKLGCMAQTVTTAAGGGFAGYPGRGQPGLLVTLLHNPVLAGKTHAGYAINWFFGIRSNYQASAAAWGWGGPLGVKLPQELSSQLSRLTVSIRGQVKTGLELLGEYRDYGLYKGAQGDWDRETLRATLQAKALAARYLLMNENPVTQAETTLEGLKPKSTQTPLLLEDFHPGESIAAYYGHKADVAGHKADVAGRKADMAIEQLRKGEERERLAIETQRQAEERERLAIENQRQAEERERLAIENQRQAEERERLALENQRQAEERERLALETQRQAEERERLAIEAQRQAEERERLAIEAQRQAEERERKMAAATRLLVTQQRQHGRSDAQLANELGYTLEEFLQRFPPSS